MDPLLFQYDLAPEEEFAGCLPEDLLALPLPDNKLSESSARVPSPSLDFNDNEDLPTELSDSSETHDEGTIQDSHLTIFMHLHICKHPLAPIT